MCALCGVLLNDHWAEQDGGRRGRTFRVGLVNRVLDHYGLALDDWAGQVYVLRDRKGRATVVDNLGVLDPGGLAGRPLIADPDLVRAWLRRRRGVATGFSGRRTTCCNAACAPEMGGGSDERALRGA